MSLIQAELARLATEVRIEKLAKATTTVPVVPAPKITSYAGGVTIEDVEDGEDGAEKSEEMTDNTPETRIKVVFLPSHPL